MDELQGPYLTWSSDMSIAIVFPKEQAVEAEEKMAPCYSCASMFQSRRYSAVFGSAVGCSKRIRRSKRQVAWRPRFDRTPYASRSDRHDRDQMPLLHQQLTCVASTQGTFNERDDCADRHHRRCVCHFHLRHVVGKWQSEAISQPPAAVN